jgi:hypothetical protein
VSVIALLGGAVLIGGDPTQAGLRTLVVTALVAVSAGIAIAPLLSPHVRTQILSAATIVAGTLLAASLTFLATGPIAMTVLMVVAAIATLATFVIAPAAE